MQQVSCLRHSSIVASPAAGSFTIPSICSSPNLDRCAACLLFKGQASLGPDHLRRARQSADDVGATQRKPIWLVDVSIISGWRAAGR